MKKALVLILLNIILMMNIQTVDAQFLPSAPSQELDVILEPFNLPSSWWIDIFLDQKQDVFEQRKNEYLDKLNVQIAKFSNTSDFKSRFVFIKELFDKYFERFYLNKTDIKLALNLEEAVTEINLLLELNSKKRQIQSTINNLFNSKISLEDSIKLRISYINQLKIKYQSIKKSNQEKLLLELDWLQAKLTYELELMSLTDQMSLIEKERINLKNVNYQIEKSITEIQIKDSDFLDLKSLNIKYQKIKNKVDEKNFDLSKNLSLDSLNSIVNEYKYFDLTVLSAQKNMIELDVIKHDLINSLAIQNNDLTTLNLLINNNNEAIKRIESEVQKRSIRIDSFLVRTSLSELNESNLKLEAKTQILARKAKTDISLINIKLDDVKLIQQIMTTEVSEKEGTLKKVVNSIINTVTKTKKGLVNLIYEPLFSIGEQPITLLPLIKIFLIILAGYMFSKIITMVIKRYEQRRDIVNNPSIYLIHRLIHYLIIFIAIMAGFKTLGINIGNITLIAGALSVGIGFGLQNIVSNFVSGITIMVEKTLSVGDFIELENGTTGTVIAINARSTHINTNDNIDIIIPNADLVTNSVTNWTLKETLCRIKIPFGVSYDSDQEEVKKATLEAADAVSYTEKNVKGKEPEVWITGFGDSSVDFWLLVWVRGFGATRPNRMKAYYLWELRNRLAKYNITIPFPQRDIHIIKNNDDIDPLVE